MNESILNEKQNKEAAVRTKVQVSLQSGLEEEIAAEDGWANLP